MKGVTREEAVLFLLSLQERIDLIVQHSPDEYNAVASGQMRKFVKIKNKSFVCLYNMFFFE